MQERVLCECTPLVDTLLCAPVKLPDYELESICIGPTGAFAIAGETTEAEPEILYGYLRELLGTAKVGLYLRGNELLFSPSGATELVLSEIELQEEVRKQTLEGHFLLWDHGMLLKIAERIRHEDARNRGIYRDSNGNWFIEQQGKFRPLSDKDPNEILRLTLWGGILGVHRFALGKWFTGLFYLLTGGLMGLGWLMDLLQIHLGSMKDKKNRVLSKPEPISLSRYLVGIAVNTALFCAYSVTVGIFSGIMIQTTV